MSPNKLCPAILRSSVIPDVVEIHNSSTVNLSNFSIFFNFWKTYILF